MINRIMVVKTLESLSTEKVIMLCDICVFWFYKVTVHTQARIEWIDLTTAFSFANIAWQKCLFGYICHFKVSLKKCMLYLLSKMTLFIYSSSRDAQFRPHHQVKQVLPASSQGNMGQNTQLQLKSRFWLHSWFSRNITKFMMMKAL